MLDEALTTTVPAMYAGEVRALLTACDRLSFTEAGRLVLVTFTATGSDNALRLAKPKIEALSADIASREAW